MKFPSSSSLIKYGLSQSQYKEIMDEQGWKCPICKREFSDTVKPCIDHEHLKGYKTPLKRKKKDREKYLAQLEFRRKHTRGILCLYCNQRRAGKGMNLEIARNLVEYFEAYEKRKSP